MWLEMDTSTYQLQNGLTGCQFIYGLTGLTESLMKANGTTIRSTPMRGVWDEN